MNSDNNSEDQALINKGKEIMRTKDLFKVLGVSKEANEKEIKRAYRKVK
jgi:preprotein translocase subunit Sec63